VVQFRINPNLDLESLARTYAREGRVRVYSLLANDDVAELLADLQARDDWWQLINTEDDVIELDRAARARMSAKRRARLEAEMHERARTGFQYCYEALRVPEDEDEKSEREDALTDFATLMSSDPMLAVLRTITGCDDISFTDGHATAYGPGDFLTCHDDDVEGAQRRAAYVFGLTRNWRPEWGGLLLFHDDEDRTVAGHVPRFNTLDLFSVPRRHSVSLVTPAAPVRRYAVTGWLRATTPRGDASPRSPTI
jgi:SM-20-related protein